MNSIRMSSKGQLVVPQNIREKEGFEPGDEFIAVPMDDGVVFKRRLSRKDAEEEFRNLSGKIQDRVKRNRIPQDTVEEAVKWARKS